MTLENAALQELLSKLDADREAYLTTLTRAHETLGRALAQSQTLSAAAPVGDLGPPNGSFKLSHLAYLVSKVQRSPDCSKLRTRAGKLQEKVQYSRGKRARDSDGR